MNLLPILTELRAEQQRLDEAIITMERLASLSGVKRRGRPPAWLAASREARKPVSAETRKKMATAARKRWGKTA